MQEQRFDDSRASVLIRMNNKARLLVHFTDEDTPSDFTAQLAHLVAVGFTDAGLRRAGEVSYAPDAGEVFATLELANAGRPTVTVTREGRSQQLTVEQTLSAAACGMYVCLLAALDSHERERA